MPGGDPYTAFGHNCSCNNYRCSGDNNCRFGYINYHGDNYCHGADHYCRP